MPPNHLIRFDYLCAINQSFMKLLLITFLLLGLSFAGIALKIWAKKDGKFDGTCASQNSNFNKEGEPCGFCGKMPEECENN